MDGPNAAGAQTEKQNCQCLNKISNFITGSLEKAFYRLVIFDSSSSCPYASNSVIYLRLAPLNLVSVILSSSLSHTSADLVYKEAK